MNPKNRPFARNPKCLNRHVQTSARFVILISCQGVKGYTNTCRCGYLAYLNDNNTSKIKVRVAEMAPWPKLPRSTIYSGKQSYSICNLAICNALFSISGAVRGLGVMSPLLVLGNCRSCGKLKNKQLFQHFIFDLLLTQVTKEVVGK